jgi:hypothetical protein
LIGFEGALLLAKLKKWLIDGDIFLLMIGG